MFHIGPVPYRKKWLVGNKCVIDHLVSPLECLPLHSAASLFVHFGSWLYCYWVGGCAN